MAETITGMISEIIYSNEDNGYCICRIENKDEEYTVVGYMPFITVGDSIEATGTWVNHLEYGEQFKIEYYSRRLPEGSEAIYHYLASGTIKGIGSATAKKIIEKFGEKSLEVIENTPELLAEIGGISEEKAVKIHEQYISQVKMQDIISFFSSYHLSASLAYKAFARFGEKAVEKVSANPYCMCEIDGIGFKTADRIASLMELDPADPRRTSAAAVFCLAEASGEGHTFLPREILCEKISETTGAGEDLALSSISQLIVEGKLRIFTRGETVCVYLPQMYIAEFGCARMIKEMSGRSAKLKKKVSDAEIDKLSGGITLAPLQKEAVLNAAENAVAVITGGPGTGKTTIIKTILKIFDSRGMSVALCAPTGRAAKRMSIACGCEAKTVHRLLECTLSPDSRKTVFARGASNPIDEEVVVVDEMSMVDISLMYHLLSAIPKNGRIIMVGDSDQLPSVGAGNVLRDIIASGTVKTVALKEIFRQAKESMIVINAHNINDGNMPEYDNKTGDFFFLKRPLVANGIKEAVSLCTTRLPSFLGLDQLSQMQVMSPSRRGESGIENLNRILQSVFNPPDKSKNEIKRPGFVLREGDKVMQIRNNYDLVWETESGETGLGIFNGDIGIIEEIDKHSGQLKLLFDGEKITYYPSEHIEDIDLAYAVTVHKSQGSEFDAVVLMVYPSHRNLMSRNLLYTAVTRAKRFVVLVGREDVVKFMCENNFQSLRYSNLANILCDPDRF